MIVLRVMQYAGHERELLEVLDALRDYPAACDEVWLPGNYGYPSLETHVANGQALIPIAERFRALGIRPSLQISNTLGHGSGRRVGEGPSASFRPMVGPEGDWGRGCFCPACEKFREYIAATVEAYCVFHPYCVWVDDDLRGEWHWPAVSYGCFCERCVAAFNERYGYSLTREEIVARMETDPEFRAQYVAMNREDIADLTRVITRAAMRVSPESYMGWEYVSVSGYIGDDFSYVFDAMREESGKPPMSRPGHGTYADHRPRELLDKALNVNYMNEIAPKYITVRRPEIENCPHTAGGKSLGGTCVESTLELAYGCNGLSYATLQGCCEPTSFHTRMWRRFAEHRPYWQRLADLNDGTTGLGGVSLFFGEHMSAAVVPDALRRFQWAEIPNIAGRRLAEAGLPLSYDRATCAVRLLHPDMVDYMTDADIRRALTMQVMTDGRTVEKLAARGFGDKLPVTAAPTYGARGDVFTDHPANRELAGRHCTVDSYNSNPYAHALTAGRGCEVLGTFPALDDAPAADATVLAPTALGGRWAVFGAFLWSPNVNGYRLRHLVYVADALANGALPAYLACVEQMCVIPRVRKSDGKTLAVTLQNLQIGETDPVLLAVRAPAAPRFLLARPGQPDLEIRPLYRSGEYLLTLPPFPAYASGTVFCE